MAVSDRTTGTGESVAHWWGQAESVCWTLDRMAKAMELCNLYVIEWGCSWSNQCHINRWVWCRGISPSQQTLVSGHRWIVLLVGSVNWWLLLECVNGLLIGWMDVFLCTFIDIIVLEDVSNDVPNADCDTNWEWQNIIMIILTWETINSIHTRRRWHDEYEVDEEINRGCREMIYKR